MKAVRIRHSAKTRAHHRLVGTRLQATKLKLHIYENYGIEMATTQGLLELSMERQGEFHMPASFIAK